jgi:hypothetical protein
VSRHFEPSVGASDEWYTPRYIFEALGVQFDLDVAAPADLTHVTTPTSTFIHADSLDVQWFGFVWMNPPFGGRNALKPWLDKFFDHGNGIALTPDRTSAPWWQDAASRADSLLHVNGRVRFVRPDGTPGASPTNGTTLFAAGGRGSEALARASVNGLGWWSGSTQERAS